MRIVLAMLLLGAEPGPISFADASFTLVPLRAEDLPPERVVQMALDFLRAVGLLVQEPPGLLELGQWRSYGWRIPRMWRLGWGPPHWPRTIEVALNARSGELIRYNSADAEDYTYQANRRGDPPQIGSQRALELAQYYLKANGGVSVPMVFDGVYVSVGSYFPVAQGPWQACKAVRRATGATGVEVLGRARRGLSRLREVEIQRWMLEGACSRPRLIASLRLSAREAVWRRLLAAVRRGRWGGTATGGLPSWRFVFHRADGTFSRGAYCPADRRLQLEDYPEPGSLVFLWPEREFERGLTELPYPPLPDSSLDGGS